MCVDNVTTPLAGRELLSFAVLINWLKLTRLLRLHQVKPPLASVVGADALRRVTSDVLIVKSPDCEERIARARRRVLIVKPAATTTSLLVRAP